MESLQPISIFWFRRDLRLDDNAGLFHALKSGKPVLPLFIFDLNILNELEDKSDARVSFILDEVKILHLILSKYQSSLLIEKGNPIEVFKKLAKSYKIESIFTNEDYEPYAINRDKEIKEFLNNNKISFFSFKDHVVFAKDEILSDSGTPYKVYTPFKNKWKQKLKPFYLKPYPTNLYFSNFFKTSPLPIPRLNAIGFKPTTTPIPEKTLNEKMLASYDLTRNFPTENSTSKLGIHLRFGTVSIRQIALKAQSLNETWLEELIWREFFIQLLFHFPYVINQPFNLKFKNFQWRHDEDDFQKWCAGQTGYPLVDAGMRELNATGFMHNRVRMVAASFLTKHLLIHWLWGERHFANKLLDYELASNNGNWQWSAGTGADAQPFIRIFNPYLQQEKFDPEFVYIKKWIPEYGTSAYAKPMIDHKEAVSRAKKAYESYKFNVNH